MASFDEIQLPANYSWGAKPGHLFSTDMMLMESSFEDRHPNWLQDIGVYDISHNIQTLAEAQELLEFFYCRFGRAYGFRMKDWNDYKAILQPMGGGPDFAGAAGLACNTTVSTLSRFGNVALMTTAGTHHLSVNQDFVLASVSDTSFNGSWTVLVVVSATQITFKCPGSNTTGLTTGTVSGNPYQLGMYYSDGIYAYFRQIFKPCSGLVTDATGYTPPIPQIYDNGVLQTVSTNYTLDLTTGLVSFISAPPAGDLLQWTGDFDVPVRFDADLAQLSMNSQNDANWDNLQLIGLAR
jgi:hypothetical protein